MPTMAANLRGSRRTHEIMYLPILYRVFFLYVEPASALVGAYFAFVLPRNYLERTHAASAPPGATSVPISAVVSLAQLANLYFLFALNEALILRSTSDLKVWRTFLFGLLVADLGHLYSVKLLGHQVYWQVWNWNAMDAGNVGFVYFGACMRIAFLLGIGVKTTDGTNAAISGPMRTAKD